MQRFLLLAPSALFALTVASCDHPTPPSSPTAPLTSPTVSISGLEEYGALLLAHNRVQLHATILDAAGNTNDCTASAQWVSANDRVARFLYYTETPGEIYAAERGETTISATCAGVTGTAVAKVGHFALRGTVKSGGQALANVEMVLPGRFTRTDQAGSFEIDMFQREFEIVVSHPGYETSQQRIVWNGQRVMNVEIELPRLSGIRIIEGEDRLCSSAPGEENRYCVPYGAVRRTHHFFSASRDGTLRLDTYFEYDYNSSLHIELRCGAAIVKSMTQSDHSRGEAFRVPARADCPYELKFAQSSRRRPVFVVRYVVTLIP